METPRRTQIQRSLSSLAQYYAASLRLLEETSELLREEFAMDPFSYFQKHTRTAAPADRADFRIDRTLLSVTFQGRVCFLGNTYPFKVLCHLAERLNAYVPYEDLLAAVWGGVRSDAAVRSVVKTLRARLRRAGLAGLADAIDGTAAGHYALKLAAQS